MLKSAKMVANHDQNDNFLSLQGTDFVVQQIAIA